MGMVSRSHTDLINVIKNQKCPIVFIGGALISILRRQEVSIRSQNHSHFSSSLPYSFRQHKPVGQPDCLVMRTKMSMVMIMGMRSKTDLITPCVLLPTCNKQQRQQRPQILSPPRYIRPPQHQQYFARLLHIIVHQNVSL